MSRYCSLVNILDTTTSPLELVGFSLKQEELGTEQLTKHELFTTELSDKMAVKSSEDRSCYVSVTRKRGRILKNVLGFFVPNKVLNHHHKD